MLKAKVILILGGTGGIGSTIADFLEKKGARVCRHGIRGEYVADVVNDQQIEGLVSGIVKKFGKIDAVINCLTAPLKIGGIEKKTWIDFQTHLGVQLKAAVDIARILLPEMKSRKSGQFINILSSVVHTPSSGIYPDYVTAKYAMLGFSKTLNEEIKKNNIFVNCVSPDFIKTELTEHFPRKLSEIVAAQNESGRLTVPDDVARVVLDLLNYPEPGGKNIVLIGGKAQKL